MKTLLEALHAVQWHPELGVQRKLSVALATGFWHSSNVDGGAGIVRTLDGMFAVAVRANCGLYGTLRHQSSVNAAFILRFHLVVAHAARFHDVFAEICRIRPLYLVS